MPISLSNSRNDLVETFLSRMSVSLCWISGCLQTVTPSIFILLKDRAVADHLDRRRTVGPALARDGAAGRPGTAFEDFRQRQRAGGHVQLFPSPTRGAGE